MEAERKNLKFTESNLIQYLLHSVTYCGSWSSAEEKNCCNKWAGGGGELTATMKKIQGCNQKFPDWDDDEINDNKHSLRLNTKGYGGKTHKVAIKLHLLAEICTICSSCSRRVRKLLDTPSYVQDNLIYYWKKKDGGGGGGNDAMKGKIEIWQTAAPRVVPCDFHHKHKTKGSTFNTCIYVATYLKRKNHYSPLQAVFV
jgi:hypothetical protein